MGTGCCSGGACAGPTATATAAAVVDQAEQTTGRATSVASVEGGEADCCAAESADCCDDETCCADDDDDVESIGESIGASLQTIECCNSREERCDEKCIIAAAAAECEKTCDDDAAHDAASDHKHVHDKDGHHTSSACSTHLSKAFEQYTAYLETARCICRSILERGLPSAACCGDHEEKSKAKRSLSASKSAAAAAAKKKRAGDHDHHDGRKQDGKGHGPEPAEADTTAHDGLHKHNRAGHHHHGMKLRKKATPSAGTAAATCCAGGGCAGAATTPAETTIASPITAISSREKDNDDLRIMAIKPAAAPFKKDTHRHDHDSDCCSGSGGGGDFLPQSAPLHGKCATKVTTSPRLHHHSDESDDVEKAAGRLELVSLVVEGMTCSGCGNKLQRALQGAAPGVSGVRVNFVMGSAEFSLDSSAASEDGTATAEDVIRAAERATGFQCSRVLGDSGGDQTLELIVPSPRAAKAVTDLSIAGISQVTVVQDKKMGLDVVGAMKGRDKKVVVRVTHDPSAIGARDLLGQISRDLGGGFGGDLQLAPPRDDPMVASGRKRLFDQLLKFIAAALLTTPVLVLAYGEASVRVEEITKASVSLALASLVQLVAVPDFYRPALSALIRTRSVEMDMLVVISITAAYGYSLVAFGFRVAGHPLETGEFFETSTLLITLVLLGRLIAALARSRAVAAVSVRSLQAATAVLVEGQGQSRCGEQMGTATTIASTRVIDARLLQHGDRFKVLPHSAVPTDGVVVAGASEVDESMLTGESAPVTKASGDVLVAGTVNLSGTLVARLTRLPGRNTVTDIARMVEDAARSKPRIQDVADRVASLFVPVVTALASLALVVWIVVGLRVRAYDPGRAVPEAITYAVAVLAVSCPCALGLAVPMVLVVAGGIAARAGVVIKSAECTERARRVSHVVFDKTGTITEPDLDVVEELYYPTSSSSLSKSSFVPDDHRLGRDEAVSVARALTSGNTHPVSVAVARHLEHSLPATTDTTKYPGLEDVRVVPGSGVEALFRGELVRAGNPQWTGTASHPEVARLKDTGVTLLVVALGSSRPRPIAIFALRTRLRPEAASVVARLQRRGIAVHLVSGDQRAAVEAVARQVGIPLANVASQTTPAQKREYVAALMASSPLSHPHSRFGGFLGRPRRRSHNNKKPVVMFVGDGTNDAVAVTQADIGVQLASSSSSPSPSSSSTSPASDITRGAADVVLLSGLGGVLFLLDVSAVAFRRMAFNFVWSAVYNVLAILLAAGAFVNVRIEPAHAGLGEIVSVLPVVLAASTMHLMKIRGD